MLIVRKTRISAFAFFAIEWHLKFKFNVFHIHAAITRTEHLHNDEIECFFLSSGNGKRAKLNRKWLTVCFYLHSISTYQHEHILLLLCVQVSSWNNKKHFNLNYLWKLMETNPWQLLPRNFRFECVYDSLNVFLPFFFTVWIKPLKTKKMFTQWHQSTDIMRFQNENG